MSIPLKLFRLQQIDTQLDQTNNRLQDIEKALLHNPSLEQASSILKKAELVHKDHHQLLSKAESLVRAQRTKIEQTESTLYSGKITNPKELQDIQNDLAAQKRYLAVLEDRQLEAMIISDESNEKLSAAASHFERLSIQVDEENAEMKVEKVGLGKDVDRLCLEKETLTNSLSSDLLSIYNQLRKQKRGIAVTKISDKNCSACGSTLTLGTIQETHSPNQITHCPSCGRILYGG